MVFANHHRGLNDVKNRRLSPSPMIPTKPSYNAVNKSRRIVYPLASYRDDAFGGSIPKHPRRLWFAQLACYATYLFDLPTDYILEIQ
jgi:hypothetical protein